MNFGKGKERIILTHLNKPMELGLAGMVSSFLFQENIAIVIDDNPKTVEYDFACLAYKKDGSAPRVMMKREFFYDIKRGTPESRTILMHELGHYYNGDNLNTKGNSDLDRESLIAQNKVSEKELKADAFAVKYLGVEKVAAGLEALKQRVLTEYADYDEESVQLTVKELEIRISYLKDN